MNRDVIVGLVAIALIAAGAAPALAYSEEQRELDADTEGVAQDSRSGDVHDSAVNITGDVTVRESENGVDETAESTGLNVTANVTVDDTTYEIPVLVVGEGTSLEQSGFTESESWRLSVQSIPGAGDGSDGQQDGQDGDVDQVTFWGNLTLVGSEDGTYHAQGNGTLTVADDGDTTTYHLAYSGEATFE